MPLLKNYTKNRTFKEKVKMKRCNEACRRRRLPGSYFCVTGPAALVAGEIFDHNFGVPNVSCVSEKKRGAADPMDACDSPNPRVVDPFRIFWGAVGCRYSMLGTKTGRFRGLSRLKL